MTALKVALTAFVLLLVVIASDRVLVSFGLTSAPFVWGWVTLKVLVTAVVVIASPVAIWT